MNALDECHVIYFAGGRRGDAKLTGRYKSEDCLFLRSRRQRYLVTVVFLQLAFQVHIYPALY